MKKNLAPWEKLREDTLCLARAHVEKALEKRPDALPLEQAIPLLRKIVTRGQEPEETKLQHDIRDELVRTRGAFREVLAGLDRLEALGFRGARETRDGLLDGEDVRMLLEQTIAREMLIPEGEYVVRAACIEMRRWLEGATSAKFSLWGEEQRTIEMWWGAKAMPRDVAVAILLADAAYPTIAHWKEFALHEDGAPKVLAWISQLVSSELTAQRKKNPK